MLNVQIALPQDQENWTRLVQEDENNHIEDISHLRLKQ